jgi:hypothetical protein
MMDLMQIAPGKPLQTSLAGGGLVHSIRPGIWRLEIPAGPAGRYRLAQLDNYRGLSRRKFPLDEPVHIHLSARASDSAIPGTWGFGLWNDPFSMGYLSGERLLRLPGLPRCAWFFFAAPPNYLTLHDDLAAQGWLAMVFQPRPRPGLWLASSLILAPFFWLSPAARLLRRVTRQIVQQETQFLKFDTRVWHHYELEWCKEGVSFWVDGSLQLETSLTPRGPLGLVLWVDNQYASWVPNGHPRWGTLENTERAWIEIRGVELQPVRNGA